MTCRRGARRKHDQRSQSRCHSARPGTGRPAVRLMQTMIDFDAAPVFAMPGFGGIGAREGMLIEGPQGWGEFSPQDDCDDRAVARWLTAAIESGTVGWPDPVRGRVPVAVTVPAVDPHRAHEI